MFRFKKQTTTSARRTRQPASPAGGSGPQSVFSYHASSRSAAADGSGVRNAAKWSWLGAAKPSLRPSARQWPKRLGAIMLALLLVILAINSLVLSREPKVMSMADSQQQVFLRSPDIYQQAARASLARSLANTNKLTIDTTGIAQDLLRQFPELEHVSVVLPIIGRQPVVYIQPAHPAVLLKAGDGGIFMLDTTGRALINTREVPKVEKLGLPLVEDQSGLPVRLGRTALPSSNTLFITEVVGQLKAKKVDITGLTLPQGTSQLDARIAGLPYIVKFNLRGDARAEAGAYLATKQYLERDHKTPGSYIDVRVDNRVYYK